MADHRQQELISASLDGELTAQEQVAVDQLLATDSDAAKLHEELRALSSTLQAMPPRRVGEDLSANVLRQVEREMLAPPAPASPGKSVSIGLNWRRYTWSALAVAAALVIMVVQAWNDPDDASSVALAPKDAAREPSASVMTEAPAEERESADALALQEAPAGAIPADAPGRDADFRFREGLFRKNEKAFGGAKGAPALSAQPGNRALKKSGDPTESIAKSGRRGQVNGLHRKTISNSAAGTSGGGGLGLAKSVDRNRVGAALKQLAQTSTKINPQGVLVVQVDVSREAAEQGTFERLLARNNIVFIGEELAAAATAPSASAPASSPAKPVAKEPAKPRAPARQPVAEAQTEFDRDGTHGTVAAAQEDLVYVVASYDQIQQTLASLGTGRDQYLSVEVNPAPEVASQRPLAAYSRGAIPVVDAQESEGSETKSPALKDSADKASENKPALGRVNSPLNTKIQQKSKSVTQDAETAKFARSARSGYAQRIQAPGANYRRMRSAVAAQQGTSGKQKLLASAQNRSITKNQPTDGTVQSDSVQAETKADAKLGELSTQTMRVLFVLRVVGQAQFKANEANQAPRTVPTQ